MQVHVRLPGLDVVKVRPVNASHVHPEDQDLGPSFPRITALTPAPPGRSLSDPESERFFVRDDADVLMPFRDIMLLEHRLGHGGNDPEIDTFPPAAVIGRSLWLVWATAEIPDATD